MDMDKLKEIGRKRQYELSFTVSLSWRTKSFTLKRAADKLYDLYFNAVLRQLWRALNESKRDKEKDPQSTQGYLEGEELEDFLDGDLITPYFLLMGYAFENLFKGIYIAQYPEKFDPDKKNTWIRSHDLVDWCVHKCKIKIDEREEGWLEKLTKTIEWQGKYPVPLELDQILPSKQEQSFSAFDGRKHQEELDDLYEKIWLVLKQTESERD